MSAKETLQRIGDLGAVLVVRAESEEDALAGVRAVVEGGIRAIEVTFTVPGAPSVIRALNREMGESILLGAGTVLHPEDAEDAVDAGAKFLVAPNTDERVIGAAKRFNMPILPGAFTPTEVVRAWDLGADAVKIFPASLGGPAYIKALKAPLPQIPMVPTGGVDEKTVGEFVKAGAFAVGAGGALFDNKKIKAKQFKEMTETAARFVAALRAALDS
ncbi:MAG: bifunctional 4-hydroxy-2-oxoglutarate aldolase/2-dehydro-3-deoxy-phosphogluconate aldolase [Planctomycetota bacterium]|nr:bifunctional 4-hydroxy-2-oxoglutarate aldolase/2-dehydro-3-deoxy-phosphogluconate aldolase [Planctomycetota bacterium]